MKKERPVPFKQASDAWFDRHKRRTKSRRKYTIITGVILTAAFASVSYLFLLAVHTIVKKEVQHACVGKIYVEKDQTRIAP